MVFRKQIQERFDKLITMKEIYRSEVKKVDWALELSKNIEERMMAPKLL
jgi:hypothetical protein